MSRTQDELIEITKDLIAIQSTAQNPKGLKAAYDLIENMIKTSGKDITVEHFVKNGIHSLLAYAGKRRPNNFRIILNGHIDVVPGKPEQFKSYIKNRRLYGRGVYDMKAAAVIMTEVFCQYANKVPYALGLQIVTDEESGGRNGTGYQVSSGVRGDFIICGECGRSSQSYEIANGAKGVCWVDIEFYGKPAHGAYLWQGDNAILQSASFIHKLLERYPLPQKESFETTVNVARISSNNKEGHTKVPDHATLRLEARFTADDQNFRSKAHIASFIEELDPNARISGMPIFEQPAYSNPLNPLLLQLKNAAEKVEGQEFKLVKRHGTSDGRFYSNVGDQSCEFGVAGEDHHGNNECISLEAFKNYYDTLQLFLQSSIKTEAANINTEAFVTV